MIAADPAVRRTLARLRLCRMQMRRAGKLVLQGRCKFTDAANTNVAKTWAKARREMTARKAVVTPLKRKRA